MLGNIVVKTNETVVLEREEVRLLLNETGNVVNINVSHDTTLFYVQLFLLLIISLSSLYVAYRIWKYFKEKEEKEKHFSKK